MTELRTVGQRVRRLDAPQRLTGQERFTGDLRVPGMLIARPVTSPYAHARIRSVDASAALEIPGVVQVLTAHDLVGGIGKDGAKSPIAADEAVFAGQFVALVLAETDAAAQDGVAAVEVDFEPLPVVSTLDAGLDPNSPHIREKQFEVDDSEAAMHNSDAAVQAESNDDLQAPNISNRVNFTRGDVAAGFLAAVQRTAADDGDVEIVAVEGKPRDQAPRRDHRPAGKPAQHEKRKFVHRKGPARPR